ncbi:MAG: TonB-dependent receptor plug domain-containing protein, partial [Bacteroidota bacterium]
GGLGSGTRVSLNGLTDDQIRIFIDGLPLELAGYPFGIANVPVSLIDRVEVYKGVVPVRFGGDALGGAINLVSPPLGDGLFGSSSYQIGSFGTHRVSADVGYSVPESGFFVRGSGFFDFARNNYEVDVTAADERGRSFDITVPRFHDRYRSVGGNFTMGVRDKKWGEEFSVRGYIVDFARQVQHNNSMTQLPFGKPESFGNSMGINTTYRVGIGDNFSLDMVAGYTRGERSFVDTSSCRFNWFGECFFRLPNEQIGEAINGGTDRVVEDEDVFVRASAEWQFNSNNRIRITTAPTYNWRTGDDALLVQSVDILNTESSLSTWVSGVEYQIRDSDKRLENRLFFKHYNQAGTFLLPDRFNRLPEEDRSNTSLFGYGNVTRIRWTERLTVKASYEYATRLPRRDEVFGDGLEITANPLLLPERSHNANVELSITSKDRAANSWGIKANGFLRITEDLITLVPTFGFLNSYFNVFDATSVGVELSGRLALLNERLRIDANSTYQSFRNLSDEGLFRDFRGDRIPNRPFFFANANARYEMESPISSQDRIDVFANTRFVYQFFRSWESAGNLGNSSIIPTQNVYGAGVSYVSSLLFSNRWTLTVEVQNLTDQVVFDFFGVQRPGRAFFTKLTTQF